MRPILREYERDGEISRRAKFARLGELGCCGMLVPEEWGGAGTDTISYALMLEEVARVDASTAVALSVTNSVVAVSHLETRHRRAKEKISRAASRAAKFSAPSASPNRKPAPTPPESRPAPSATAIPTC